MIVTFGVRPYLIERTDDPSDKTVYVDSHGLVNGQATIDVTLKVPKNASVYFGTIGNVNSIKMSGIRVQTWKTASREDEIRPSTLVVPGDKLEGLLTDLKCSLSQTITYTKASLADTTQEEFTNTFKDCEGGMIHVERVYNRGKGSAMCCLSDFIFSKEQRNIEMFYSGEDTDKIFEITFTRRLSEYVIVK